MEHIFRRWGQKPVTGDEGGDDADIQFYYATVPTSIQIGG
jgi:hypothetical protein